MRASLRVIAVATAVLVWGCTVKEADNPPETGPSELALSLQLQASPDVLPQDGSSQAQITIIARDANARPVSGLPLRADISVGGVVQDFGQLNTKSVATGGDGRAVLTYTAPASVDGVSVERTIQVRVMPIGTDATATLPRVVNIRLVASGVVTPVGPNVPDFTIDPNPAEQGQYIIFDASDEDLDGDIVSYDWDYGDGSTGSGRVAEHAYDDADSYVVTLTVTDSTGAQSSRPKTVTVMAGEAPTAAFTYSPADPSAGDTVFFNGSGSTAASGRTIVAYSWNFGNSTGTVSGKIVSRVFSSPGTYTVTLTVRDDAGQTSTVSQEVEVL
jgi:chitodextrinase